MPVNLVAADAERHEQHQSQQRGKHPPYPAPLPAAPAPPGAGVPESGNEAAPAIPAPRASLRSVIPVVRLGPLVRPALPRAGRYRAG